MRFTVTEILSSFSSLSSIDNRTVSDANNFSSIAKSLEEESDEAILGSIANIDDSESLAKYVCCLLSMCSRPTEKSCDRRRKIFGNAISLLKTGKLNSQGARQVIDPLFINLRLLREKDAQQCAEEVLDNLWVECKSTNELSGRQKTLELLPQLALRGGRSCKKYLFDRLCSMKWPRDAVVMLSAALIELCDSEEECRAVTGKLVTVIGWLRSSDDDIPTLLYQLTSLGRKCRAITSLNQLVISSVSEAMDKLLLTMPPSGTEGYDRASSVIGSVTVHLSMLISKDQVRQHYLSVSKRIIILRTVGSCS